MEPALRTWQGCHSRASQSRPRGRCSAAPPSSWRQSGAGRVAQQACRAWEWREAESVPPEGETAARGSPGLPRVPSAAQHLGQQPSTSLSQHWVGREPLSHPGRGGPTLGSGPSGFTPWACPPPQPQPHQNKLPEIFQQFGGGGDKRLPPHFHPPASRQASLPAQGAWPAEPARSLVAREAVASPARLTPQARKIPSSSPRTAAPGRAPSPLHRPSAPLPGGFPALCSRQDQGELGKGHPGPEEPGSKVHSEGPAQSASQTDTPCTGGGGEEKLHLVTGEDKEVPHALFPPPPR